MHPHVPPGAVDGGPRRTKPGSAGERSEYDSSMGTLDAKGRARLPDSAFAYVDSRRTRRLPIHDEAHVRNALARFNQVKYESEDARERAFRKLLRAAAAYGIAPVGFVAARLREASASADRDLPTGQVTLLMTDMERSTELVATLGDAYPELLSGVRGVVSIAVERASGVEVDVKADETFSVFLTAADALRCAVEIQHALAEISWAAPVRLRIGLHSGSPARTDTGYVGMPVHTVARLCAAGHGGQILVSATTQAELVADAAPEGFGLTSLGHQTFRGLREPIEVFQVGAAGLPSTFPPLRIER